MSNPYDSIFDGTDMFGSDGLFGFVDSPTDYLDPDFVVNLIQTYVPEAEYLTYDEAAGLAILRDAKAAEELTNTIFEGGLDGETEGDPYSGNSENGQEPKDSV